MSKFICNALLTYLNDSILVSLVIWTPFKQKYKQSEYAANMISFRVISSAMTVDARGKVKARLKGYLLDALTTWLINICLRALNALLPMHSCGLTVHN